MSASSWGVELLDLRSASILLHHPAQRASIHKKVSEVRSTQAAVKLKRAHPSLLRPDTGIRQQSAGWNQQVLKYQIQWFQAFEKETWANRVSALPRGVDG
jgi:hypothetical protein